MKTLTRLSLAHPRAALAAVLAATLFFAAGLPRLQTAVGYRAFLGDGHPAVRRFDEFLARFEGGLPLALVYSCDGGSAPCASVFDADALAMARDVSAALAGAPGVRRVESLATATLFVPERPPLPPRPRHFIEDGAPAPDREALGLRARADRLWRGSLISDDGRIGALVVDVAASDGDTALAVWTAAQRATAPFEARGYQFRAVGGPVEFVVAGGELEAATRRMVPLMVLLIAGGVIVLLRSPAASVALLATTGVAVLWTLGALGWIGWPQNTLTQILPPIVLVIGTCDGLHLLSRVAAEREERLAAAAAAPAAGAAADSGEDLRALVLRAAEDVGSPCLTMTLTTIGGFLSFATSDLEAFVRFGVAASFGVGASLLLSFGLLPIALLRFPPRPAPDVADPGALESVLVRMTRAVERRAGMVLAIAALAALASAYGVTRLRVEASFEDLYGEHSRVVEWVRFVREHLRRPDTLEVEIALPPGTDVAAPETLAALTAASDRLAALPDVGRVRSLLDPLAWANRLATGDDPRLERPAATERGNRLLLDVLARDPGGLLARYYDAKDGRVRLSLETEKPPQDRLRALVEGSDQALRATLPSGWTYVLTGPVVLVRDMLESIQSSQITSFLQAWATVVLLVALFLRSLRVGFLVMLPTVLPVIATVGTMGLLGIPLDPGSAMVAAVVLGISDDDAIHLLTQYQRLRADGLGVPAAIEGAMVHAGRAIVTTSLSLALGFSTLALSPWRSVASFGVLSALAILAALLGVLVVLPAALYGFGRLSASGSASVPRSAS